MFRFYLPGEEWRNAEPTLTGAEARHCLEVLRHPVGAEVEVFDGEGTVALARISQTGRGRATLELGPPTRHAPERPRMILGLGLIKTKAMELALQKAVELGVAEIQPLLTERSVVNPEAADKANRREKLQSVLLQACKQSHRSWLPRLHSPVSLAEWIREFEAGPLRLVASLRSVARPLSEVLPPTPCPSGQLHLAVGPEGDFSEKEYVLLKGAGFREITMGPRILRTETAVCYLLSVVHHHFSASCP